MNTQSSVVPSPRRAPGRVQGGLHWRASVLQFLSTGSFTKITVNEILSYLTSKGYDASFDSVKRHCEWLCQTMPEKFQMDVLDVFINRQPEAAPAFQPMRAPTLPPPSPAAPAQNVFQPPPPQIRPGLKEVVFKHMTDLVLRQRVFVVEKLIQSLSQRDMGEHIHIKDIGNEMYAFSQQNNLAKWKNNNGSIGESMGYALNGVAVPEGWLRIG